MISKRLLLVALLVMTVLAACGKDDTKPASSGDPTETETSETTSTTAAAAPPTEVNVTGTEYAYALDDDTDPTAIPAGPVTVTLTNDGEEEHQVSIVRLEDGKTQDDFLALGNDTSKLDEVLQGFGGPNGVGPDASNTSTQVLEPGDYFFACFIPAPDGAPHAAKGMLLPITVTGDAPDAEEEGDGESIEMSDYSFGLGSVDEPAEIDGGDDIRFTNEGPQIHEAVVYAPAEGSTAQDVLDYFSDPNASGPPPIVSIGGVGPIDVGRETVASLEPGEYIFMCFIPDVSDGAPHFAKGMIEFATVG